MGFSKWIMGGLGWAVLGPIGGVIGFLIGSVFDSSSVSVRRGTGIPGGFYNQEEQRNSFLISMMVLSVSVMKADGRVLRSELEYVKGFIRANFGEEAMPQALKIIKALISKDIDLQQVCGQIKTFMPDEGRMQLFHYLAGIAKADGTVSDSERSVLTRIAVYLGISSADAAAVLAMFAPAFDPYKVLEIEPSATDDEVKKAYRTMAMKFHPDRVATLGEDVKRAAESKFKTIGDAYQKIKDERGLN